MNNENFKTALIFLKELAEQKQDFGGINLAETVLDQVHVQAGCNFKGANFQGCRLVSTRFAGCLMPLALFDGANLQTANLSQSDCREASFQRADLRKTDFTNSQLLDANFRKANLDGAIFRQADLRGVDFRGALLGQADFREAFYDDNTLFETRIDPVRLGMRKLATASPSKPPPKAENPISSPEVAPNPKPKGIMYRGVLVEAPETSVNNAPTQPSPANKSELTYRGVKISS
jgi:uncharacterized protein YjbI with pentapeptide repeats